MSPSNVQTNHMLMHLYTCTLILTHTHSLFPYESFIPIRMPFELVRAWKSQMHKSISSDISFMEVRICVWSLHAAKSKHILSLQNVGLNRILYTHSFVHKFYFHSSFDTFKKAIHAIPNDACVCVWKYKICWMSIPSGSSSAYMCHFELTWLVGENVYNQIVYGIMVSVANEFLALCRSVVTKWTNAEWNAEWIEMWGANHIQLERQTMDEFDSYIHAFIPKRFAQLFGSMSVHFRHRHRCCYHCRQMKIVHGMNNDHSQYADGGHALMHCCYRNDDDSDSDSDNSQSSLRGYWSIERYHM